MLRISLAERSTHPFIGRIKAPPMRAGAMKRPHRFDSQ
jgi:hypothetical protein